MKCKSKLKLKLNYADLCPRQRILVLLLLVFRSEVLPAKPSQAKLEVKSAFDFAEILDSLFADFISQNSNMLAVSRGRCNFRLYWSLLACLQLLSHSAIQLCKVFLFENNKTPRHSIEPRIRMQIRIP